MGKVYLLKIEYNDESEDQLYLFHNPKDAKLIFDIISDLIDKRNSKVKDKNFNEVEIIDKKLRLFDVYMPNNNIRFNGFLKIITMNYFNFDNTLIKSILREHNVKEILD
jgi:hypothetical protein